MDLPAGIPLGEETRLALQAAADAGEALLGYWRGDDIREEKADGEPVSIADRAADGIIRGALQEAYPADGILSEEHPDDGARLERRRVWIIDPLDGTRDYLDGTPEFAVHIALAVDGAPALGVVHAPALERTWLGLPGHGAWARNEGAPWAGISVTGLADPIRVAVTRRPLGRRTAVFRSHLPPHVLVRSGGCGLKAARVAQGSCDLYAAVTRRMKEWDLCAAHAVAEAAGAVCTDLGGAPLVYNAPDVVARGGFLVASREAQQALRPAIDAARAALDG